MSSILRVQASRAWHGRAWRYATLVGFAVVALSFAQSCLMFWGHDAAELPSAAVGWVGDEETMRTPLMGLYRTILMPILASSVFSDSLCLDIRDHVAACVSSRTSVRRYVCSTAVVAFVGLSPDVEGEELKVDVPGFDGGDRNAIGLPAAQQALLERAKAAGKPLVVVLMSGSAVALNWAQQHGDAIVAAW